MKVALPHMTQLSVAVLTMLTLVACHSTPQEVDDDVAHAHEVIPSPVTPMVSDASYATAPLGRQAVRMNKMEIQAFKMMPEAISIEQVRKSYNERYQHTTDNPVYNTTEQPISTFSVDVDTGSYSNSRRMLNDGRLPPADAVRAEEFINYFNYEYPRPKGSVPFAVHTQVIHSPYKTGAKLVRIGIKGKETTMQALPPANLVFLVDVSGSMNSDDKLPLVKQTLRLLTDQLRDIDSISIVTYADGEKLALPATYATAKGKEEILRVINALQAGGATAGERAIELAYSEAQKHYKKDGINRILLMTDGDFNVGISDFETLKSMVAQKRKSGVSLSTFGYGMGNYNEQLMEQIADAGDGNYSYIDSKSEAKKVLHRQLTSTLATIAQDVKIQVEFNPATVSEYRLIGYQNRLLNEEDFKNDKVDAGDIGAGHTVTALYEIIPVGVPGYLSERRYADKSMLKNQGGNEYAHVAVRYKLPNQPTSTEMSQVIARTDGVSLDKADDDARFAVAVASFAELLRGGKYAGDVDYDAIIKLAKSAQGADKDGTRAEFIELVGIAKSLEVKTPAQVAEK